MQYYLLTLGCPKNTVDSEGMAMLLSAAGYEGVSVPKNADVIIVNTCGFLEAAEEESLAALRDLAQHKRRGQTFIAAGCMAQRAGDRIVKEVPGVDGLLGTRRWMEIVPFVQGLRGGAGQRAFGRYALLGDPEQALVRRHAPAAGCRGQRLLEDQRRLQCALCFLLDSDLQRQAAQPTSTGNRCRSAGVGRKRRPRAHPDRAGYQRLRPRLGPARLAA